MHKITAALALVIATGCTESHEPQGLQPVSVSGYAIAETPEGRSGEMWDGVWIPGESLHMPGCVLSVGVGHRETCSLLDGTMVLWDYLVTEHADGVCMSAVGLWVPEHLGEQHVEITWCSQ